jgi:hypothetical protein
MAFQRGLAALFGASLMVACVTTRDAVGGGDARVDEGQSDRAERGPDKAGRLCGPDGKGDLVLIDARTGGPATCLEVSISREAMTCPLSTECPSDVVFRGATNKLGQVVLNGPLERARLVAVADGYGPSVLANASSTAGRVLELELAPAEGFWLKVLDGDGNYLQDLSLTFKQGEEVVAQLRSNTLANVFFSQRQPFAGQAVSVEAPGFRPAIVANVSELGEDGHTLVLTR